MKFFTLPCTKQKSKRREIKTLSNFIISISKTPEKLSLVPLVINYHKLLFSPLVSDPDENLKNKSHCKIFNLVTATSNKLYFQSLHESF